VTFVKEIVPRQAIATIARVVYNENYVARPMRSELDLQHGTLAPNGRVAYGWREAGKWHQLRVSAVGEPRLLEQGSAEEFIAEHYWGYAAQRDGGCVEYQVEHPPWRVWRAGESEFDCDIERVYGRRFVECLSAKPASALVAEGSPIIVRRGVRI
jgi:hypothetical protein